jgi:hypothetical protein
MADGRRALMAERASAEATAATASRHDGSQGA